jgi:hypothetical protein
MGIVRHSSERSRERSTHEGTWFHGVNRAAQNVLEIVAKPEERSNQ